jgi:hypothetical protein
LSRIVLLTPDPEDEAYHGRWREVFDRMARPLTAAGLDVESRPWTQAGDLEGFAAVMPLVVWGYHRAGERWLAQVADWERAGVRLMNPGSVLRWNADKRYLGVLADRGAPVVTTLFVDEVTLPVLQQAADRFGSDRLVAKPQVSASAYQTLRWSPGGSLEEGPEGPAMIQAYLPLIETEGEVSLFYFSGVYSHAVRKVPQRGDFRVQPEFEGVITAHEPTGEERAAAEAVLGAVDEPLLYARVDLVRDLEAEPALIELELIEPDLYLGYAADKGAAFVQAVASAV